MLIHIILLLHLPATMITMENMAEQRIFEY